MSAAVSACVSFALFGLPLFCVLTAIGLFGLHDRHQQLALAVADVYKLAGALAETLMTIPLFTFAGYLMASAKTAHRLIRMAEAILGWIPGGLAVMTVLTCAFFTTFTGASGVTIVAVGGLILPELMRSGYKRTAALEVVTGSGSVGLLFVPALPLFVYGTVFAVQYGLFTKGMDDAPEFAIDKFLFCGTVPGLVLVGLLVVYCVIKGAVLKVPRRPVDTRAFLRALWEAKWEIPIPIGIIAFLKFGIALPAESAARTALYVFVIEVFVYRDIKLRDVLTIARESMTLVGAIFMKIVGATVLTTYFVEAEIPQRLFDWISNYVHAQWSYLLLLNLVLLLVGCMMDIFSAIIVVVPLMVPAVVTYHINPYHLGVIFLLNLEIGYLLPPAGLNLFIAAFRFNRPITELYRAVVGFILVMVVALLLVTYIPQLTVVFETKLPPGVTSPIAPVAPAAPIAPAPEL